MRARQMALDALKLAVLQNGCDMIMTGEELRKCESAIEALEADIAQAVEPVGQSIITALRFYANSEHYMLDDDDDFDTVSGEPENWLCSGRDESSTMIEDGTIARRALRGEPIQWIDGDEDGTPKPIEGEATQVVNADLLDALQDALSAVKTFHGPECWDIYYDNAPEMKRIRAAIKKATS